MVARDVGEMVATAATVSTSTLCDMNVAATPVAEFNLGSDNDGNDRDDDGEDVSEDWCPCCDRYSRIMPELMRIMDSANRDIARLLVRLIDTEEGDDEEDTATLRRRSRRRQVLDRRQEAMRRIEWQRAAALCYGQSLAYQSECPRRSSHHSRSPHRLLDGRGSK